MPTVLGRDVVAGQGAASAASSSMNDRARFVGTWELVTTEVKDPATGRWSPTPNFNSNGYIIYADTGHMGVHIQPKVRARFAANPPTGEEAQAALRGYTAYFGSFAVSDKEKEKFVVHHRFGQINPGGDVDVKRFYDFVTTPNGSQRLILTPPPADGGGKDKATRRLVWQRMLDAPLSAEAEEVRRVLEAALHGQLSDERRERGLPRRQGRDARRHVLHHLHVVGPHDGPSHEQRGADEVRGRAADTRRGAQGVSGATTATSDGS